MTVETRLKTDQAALALEQASIAGTKETVRRAALIKNLASLATFYNKMKAPAAAEILQAGTLDDTTVALLLKRLQPGLSAKIFASMEPQNAAGITKIMHELPQESEQ